VAAQTPVSVSAGIRAPGKAIGRPGAALAAMRGR
jgi:hypothetical protein